MRVHLEDSMEAGAHPLHGAPSIRGLFAPGAGVLGIPALHSDGVLSTHWWVHQEWCHVGSDGQEDASSWGSYLGSFLGLSESCLIARTHGRKQRSFRTFELSDFQSFRTAFRLSGIFRNQLSDFRTGAQFRHGQSWVLRSPEKAGF